MFVLFGNHISLRSSSDRPLCGQVRKAQCLSSLAWLVAFHRLISKLLWMPH